MDVDEQFINLLQHHTFCSYFCQLYNSEEWSSQDFEICIAAVKTDLNAGILLSNSLNS